MKSNIFSRYNREENIRSIYFYPDCDVIKNRLDIKDDKALTAIEEDLTNQRLVELAENPLQGRLGIAHLKNIHKYIFQDIYYFAGKFREEDISKGNTLFYKCQFVNQALKELFEELESEKYLVGLDKNTFSNRAAYYMAELNMVHPFREGNGRAIREYIRCLALKCGYIIDWSLVDAQKLLEATILSVNKNYVPLAECLSKSIGVE